MASRLAADPVPLDSHPGIRLPASLVRIVERMLRRSPGERFATLDAVAMELSNIPELNDNQQKIYKNGQTVRVSRQVLDSIATASGGPVSTHCARSMAAPPAAPMISPVILCSGVVLVFAMGTFGLWRFGRDRSYPVTVPQSRTTSASPAVDSAQRIDLSTKSASLSEPGWMDWIARIAKLLRGR